MKTNLILWRHAEAEAGEDDLARWLTARGQKQAARMADWLRERLPTRTRVIASEALRARQTAATLNPEHAVDRRLNPGAAASDYLAACDWPESDGTTVLVGHQPTIGRVAASLLAGIEADWTVRKGGIWWLQFRLRDGVPQTVLKTMLTPEQL
ncbi:SixA phosphatase family protein [Chitinimonas koreensis]|uniref:SixA phosphatase family protein n=1 Tax=Chitinimonas koreensis TaxID=356302 RepID=UPI00041CDA45|nr:histidine phosphatase family protein [Chitinimonas koreensis]QNM97094.1 histidine phosphatase family protein [Chitinimonas koreensis]